MCGICTALEFYLFVLVLSIINGVTFVKTHRMSFNFLSVKRESSASWTLMYMQLEGLWLCPEPRTILAEKYTLRKKQESSYETRDLPTSRKADARHASIPHSRRPWRQVQEGGSEWVIPGKDSPTRMKPLNLPRLLILPEITPQSSSGF